MPTTSRGVVRRPLILTARFLLGWDFSSKIISWRSGGPSHVDFLADDESGWWSAFSVAVPGFEPGRTIEPGCRKRPKNYYGTPKHVTYVRIGMTSEEWGAFWGLVESTKGAPYDTSGLLSSFVLMRAITPPRKWR